MRQPMTGRERIVCGAAVAALIGLSAPLVGRLARPVAAAGVDPDWAAYHRGEVPGGLDELADRFRRRAEDDRLPTAKRVELMAGAARLYETNIRYEDAFRAYVRIYEFRKPSAPPDERARMLDDLLSFSRSPRLWGVPAERRRLYAEWQAIEAGLGVEPHLSVGRRAEAHEIAWVLANLDDLSAAEADRLRAAVRELVAPFVREWQRTGPADIRALDYYAWAVAEAGDRELAARMKERASVLWEAITVRRDGRPAVDLVGRPQAVRIRYPDPCDLRRLDALHTFARSHPDAAAELDEPLAAAFLVAGRPKDAAACYERLLARADRPAAVRWLARLYRAYTAAGDESAAAEADRRLRTEYADLLAGRQPGDIE